MAGGKAAATTNNNNKTKPKQQQQQQQKKDRHQPEQQQTKSKKKQPQQQQYQPYPPPSDRFVRLPRTAFCLSVVWCSYYADVNQKCSRGLLCEFRAPRSSYDRHQASLWSGYSVASDLWMADRSPSRYCWSADCMGCCII